MSMNRRTFLMLTGCAVAALAVPGRLFGPGGPPLSLPIKQQIVRLQFYASTGLPVGPIFAIPPEWWRVSGGKAVMNGVIEVYNWDGPTCLLTGAVLWDDAGNELLRFPISFNAAVCQGDSVMLPNAEITLGGA